MYLKEICKQITFACVVILSISSCGLTTKHIKLYEGKSLPPDKVSILMDCQGRCQNYNVWIKNIQLSTVKGDTQTELLPGEYEIKVNFDPIRYTNVLILGKDYNLRTNSLKVDDPRVKRHTKILSFKAEEGKTYAVKCKLKAFRPSTLYYTPEDWDLRIEEIGSSASCDHIRHFNPITGHSGGEHTTYTDDYLFGLYASVSNWAKSTKLPWAIKSAEEYKAEMKRREFIRDEDWPLVDEQKINVGMSEEGLLASWGAPNSVGWYDQSHPKKDQLEKGEYFLEYNGKLIREEETDSMKNENAKSGDKIFIIVKNGFITKIKQDNTPR